MKFFIYGTLKSDCCNHHVLQRFSPTKLSDATTTNLYPMYTGESYFPYVENRPGVGSYISGELYEIPDIYETDLDRFEGVPHLYVKGRITVQDKEGTIHDVYTYFKATDTPIEVLMSKPLLSEWKED